MRTASAPIKETSELLGWKMLSASVAQLTSDEPAARSSPFRILPAAQRRAGEAAYRRDGSYIYADAETRPKALDELRRTALEGAVKRQFFWIRDYRLDIEARDLFRFLLEDARARGVQVMILLPPYQPYVLQRLLEAPERAAALGALRSQLAWATGDRGDVPVCDATRAEDLGCAETDFIDGYHARAGCIERLLRHCLADRTDWAPLLAGRP